MNKFQIRHRWTDAVLFEGDFDTMRLCVEAAVRVRADLAGAYLAGADLAGAYLAGADFVGADLVGAYLTDANLAGAYLTRAKWREGVTLNRAPVKECTRTDGFRFLLLDTDVGWRVQAGCRFFSLEEAWWHWETTRARTPLGEETFDILVMFEHQIEREEARV